MFDIFVTIGCNVVQSGANQQNQLADRTYSQYISVCTVNIFYGPYSELSRVLSPGPWPDSLNLTIICHTEIHVVNTFIIHQIICHLRPILKHKYDPLFKMHKKRSEEAAS